MDYPRSLYFVCEDGEHSHNVITKKGRAVIRYDKQTAYSKEEQKDAEKEGWVADFNKPSKKKKGGEG